MRGGRRDRGGDESANSQGPIIAVVPLMLLTMATILMLQLQSFQRLFLVVAAAPLGLIGVVAALVPSGAPLGFVALLDVLALIGILIRNSVILIVQIEDLITEGKQAWDAVIEATEHRMRPIALTAAAASLALIPIAREVFWGPMAYAMMGGIIAGDHAAVPASALCRLVPHQGTNSGRSRGHVRAGTGFGARSSGRGRRRVKRATSGGVALFQAADFG